MLETNGRITKVVVKKKRRSDVAMAVVTIETTLAVAVEVMRAGQHITILTDTGSVKGFVSRAEASNVLGRAVLTVLTEDLSVVELAGTDVTRVVKEVDHDRDER